MAFVQAVDRAIDANPEARFASAGEMLAALRIDQVSRQTDDDGWLKWLKTRVREMGALSVAAAATIALLAVVGTGILFTKWQARAIGPVSVRSVAVIVDGKSEGESNVLAAGFAEGLTSTLGKIEALKVTQQSTASRYSDTHAITSAADLGVDAIVRLHLRAGAPADPGHDRDVEVTAELFGRGIGAWASRVQRAPLPGYRSCRLQWPAPSRRGCACRFPRAMHNGWSTGGAV